jgi:hypothetical protein
MVRVRQLKPFYVGFRGAPDLLCLIFELGGRRRSEAMRTAVVEHGGLAGGVCHLLTGLWFSASGGGGGGVVELGFRVCGGSDSKELR